jgi:hypothetical protein
MKKYDYRIVKPRVKGHWPFLVQKNIGVIFDDWGYDKTFETLEEAEAYVKDKVWPQVIVAYKIGKEP